MKSKVQGMKRKSGLIITFVMAVVMVMMLDVFSSISLASSGKTNSNAKIRKEASTNSTAVGSVTKGTAVEISGETKGNDGKVWYKVTVDGTTGYIRSDLIDVTNTDANTGNSGNDNQTAAPVDGLEQVVPIEATISGGTTVRVRTSASTANSNNILTTVANGTKVTLVARTTGSDKKLWYQVKFTANGNEVIGYIRNDYLTITEEVKPLTEENMQPQEQETQPQETQQEEPTQNTETNVPTKRYDTKLVNEKWYLLDYEANKQYDIDQVFSAAKEFEELYNKEKGKTKSLKTWLTFFIILSIVGCGAAGYLFYRRKEASDAAYFESFNNDSYRRTSDRPKNGSRSGSAQAQGREKPVIKEGMEPRREEGQRPVQNGQRQTGNRQQGSQRPAQQGGQRPAQQGNQRPAQQQGGQRPVQQQGGQRPAQAQGQSGARPNGAQNPQNAQRPVNRQPGRPQEAPQRPANAQPQGGAPEQQNARPKNFAGEDEREFEFLNWDSDDE